MSAERVTHIAFSTGEVYELVDGRWVLVDPAADMVVRVTPDGGDLLVVPRGES
mgnify:CR=1 FL=1